MLAYWVINNTLQVFEKAYKLTMNRSPKYKKF